MADIVEFRVLKEYAHLLIEPGEGKDNGSNITIHIPKDDPRFSKIGELTRLIRAKYDDYFFIYHRIRRKYRKNELDAASLFRVIPNTTFEPSGVECGTKYDESYCCDICGSNASQIGHLFLRKSSVPKKDIARTIAGEVIVSKKFKEISDSYKFKGLKFDPIYSGKRPIDFFQIKSTSPMLIMSENSIGGIDPFDFSESSGEEVYKCPRGHTIGLNILSEVYVERNDQIEKFDFFETKQKIGVKRGLLRPEALSLCSPDFRSTVIKEKLKGFEFEIAHIDN